MAAETITSMSKKADVYIKRDLSKEKYIYGSRNLCACIYIYIYIYTYTDHSLDIDAGLF